MIMLILFVRAVLLYAFILLILRLTGKRQVSDLQPYDLLITLSIADLASCAIADVDIPLLYSVVPILALFLVQQAISKGCVHLPGFRKCICGSPLILVRDGVLEERTMKEANYTVDDLVDCLRAKDIFDIGQVAYAILETNGSMSILQKGAFQQPTLQDLNLAPDRAELSHMLILDGRICFRTLERLQLGESFVKNTLKSQGVRRAEDVYYMQLAPDGEIRMQVRGKKGDGARVLIAKGKEDTKCS